MRVAFGLAGLALSVVAIGACGEGHYKDADAVTCMAYLSLQSAAIGNAAGDTTALDAANAAWRSLAEQKYTADELAQYFASTVAVFDDVAADEREMISATCQAQAPRGV